MSGEIILDNALQSIFDNLHAFIFLKDKENRLVKVNKWVADSHGLTPEDMVGRHTSEFYGDQAEAYHADDMDVIRSGKAKLNIVEPLPISEDDLRWIETSKIPVHDRTGDIVGILVIANDVTEKRETEQALGESQAMIRTILDNFSESLAFYDADRRLAFGNPTFWELQKYTGIDDVAKVGAKFEDIIKAVSERVSEAREGKDPATFYNQLLDDYDKPQAGFEARIRDRWIRVHRYPTPDGGRILFGYNITERKKAEQALEANRALLNTVVENFSEMLTLHDPEGRLKFGNRAYWKFHDDAGTKDVIRIGATFEENARAMTARLAELDDTVDPQSIVDKILQQHQDPTKEIEFLWGRRHIRIRRYPTPDGGGITLGYDVTASHQAERALKESEKRYHTLAETAPVGIFRTTPAGICSYHNEVWHDITGTSRRDASDLPWTAVFKAGDRERIAAAWRTTALREGGFQTEGRIAGQAGRETWVLATIAVEESSAGEPSAFIGTLTDISKLKQVETQLRATEQALREHRDQLEVLVERRTAALREAQQSLLQQERLAAIGQLTATVSHELRNPLGTITTSFAALKRRLDLSDEKAIRASDRIERNIRRCETIIRDLLNYTRIEMLNCEDLDLDNWVSQFLGELELPPDVTLKTDLRASGKARIDRTRMAQVMTNLIGNALDAMKEGPAPEPVLEVETGRHGTDYLIQVRDVGTGLSAENLERVFEPLVSTKTYGVGLGLPLVRQIVELHGGRVEIRNNETRGAEVEVTLPAQIDRERDVAQQAIFEQTEQG